MALNKVMLEHALGFPSEKLNISILFSFIIRNIISLE